MFPVADVIPSRTRPYVTIGLIALTALAFGAELLLGDLLPRVVFALGLVPIFFSFPDLLSSLFLHTGWLHVVGNMLYLWIFGDTVEDRLGHARFLTLYLACGAAAGLGHVAFDPSSSIPAIGASGAISGVLGAYFVLYPHSRILTAVYLIVFLDLVEIPAIVYLGIWFVLQVASGVGSIGLTADGGLAIWSDVVGFAAGAALGWLWRGNVDYWRRRGSPERGGQKAR
jgi:membrane associated rhomboid family serine protease